MKAGGQQPDSKTRSAVAATRPQQSLPQMDGPHKKGPRAPAAPAPAQPTPDGLAAAPEAEGAGKVQNPFDLLLQQQNAEDEEREQQRQMLKQKQQEQKRQQQEQQLQRKEEENQRKEEEKQVKAVKKAQRATDARLLKQAKRADDKAAAKAKAKAAAALAPGEYVIKCQSLSKRARQQLLSYVSESTLRLKSVLNDTLARG